MEPNPLFCTSSLFCITDSYDTAFQEPSNHVLWELPVFEIFLSRKHAYILCRIFSFSQRVSSTSTVQISYFYFIKNSQNSILSMINEQLISLSLYLCPPLSNILAVLFLHVNLCLTCFYFKFSWSNVSTRVISKF